MMVCSPIAGAAAPSWVMEQPAPPDGAVYKVPVGSPGDIKFIAPNRGLLATSGNAVVPAGLLYWNGERWSMLASVCGGSAATMRIAVAGPDEFWTVSSPSRPRVGDGIALCHFKQGEVVGSYAKQPQDADPYWQMNAAACAAPDDCWFGGVAASDPTGLRQGTFRIHWDGSHLSTSYGPQGRGTGDLLAVEGTSCPVTVTDEWPGAAGWGVVVATVPKGYAAAAAIAAARQDASSAGAAQVSVVDSDRHRMKPAGSWLVVARYGSRALASAALPSILKLRAGAVVSPIAAFDPKTPVTQPIHMPRIYEGVLAGVAPGSTGAADNPVPERSQVLLHYIDPASQGFVADPFQPAALPGVPDETLDMLALDGDGTTSWAAASGAASGPFAPGGGMFNRRPMIAVSTTGSDCSFGDFRELPVSGNFQADERIVDVAAVPGTTTAFVAVQPYADRASRNAYATVAKVDATSGTVERMQVPADGSGHGAASKVACSSVNDCWLVTTAGWIYHWTDGTRPTVDTDPSFQSLITYRPNESAAQFIPDTPPVDDSQKFAPPPVKPLPKRKVKTKRIKLKPLMAAVTSKVNGMNLTISFTLRRKARVGLIARSGSRVVARTPDRMLRPGRHSLTLPLSRKAWPTGLAFSVVEPGRRPERKKPADPGGGLIGN